MTATHWLAFALGVVVGQLGLLGAIAFGMAAKRGDRTINAAQRAEGLREMAEALRDTPRRDAARRTEPAP